MREHRRVYADDAQRNQEHDEHREVFAHHDLGHRKRQGIEELIGLLPLLLGKHAHREYRDDDEEDKRHAAQHIFKIADGGSDVVGHGVYPREQQQERAEHIARKPREI